MKNQVLIVFDSLRWDIFQESRAPFLKGLGNWKKAFTPGTYTLPAHMSFFAGKLPHTLDETEYYDTVATRTNENGPLRRQRQFWRLSNPEAPTAARIQVDGENIIDGFRRLGYLTVGTGGVNWFNPQLPAGRHLTRVFELFRFFDGPDHASHESAEYQIEWVQESLAKSGRPYFLFVNFGETHYLYRYRNCPWHGERPPYGNTEHCRVRQRRCLEYLDGQVQRLLGSLSDFDLVLCSDHGEAMGEDGLWGHGFFHPTIMEVPILIRPAPE